MGCGCKGDKANKKVDENVKFSFKKFAINILASIGTTILLVVLSPIILLVIWYLIISNIFGVKINLINLITFNKKNKVESEEEPETFNIDDYELMDVDKV